MKKIKKILIGTHNKGKFKEISYLLPKSIKKYSPKELKILSPKEKGKSFSENAELKASYFCKNSNMISISDDSGLKIDLLGGYPGIFSARWGGPKKNFDLAIKKVFKELKKKSIDWQNKNKATFVCCLSIKWPNKKKITVEGKISGKIANSKKGLKGFGYDPIFIPKGYKKTFGEMNPKFKASIDHRFKAFKKIKKYFF